MTHEYRPCGGAENIKIYGTKLRRKQSPLLTPTFTNIYFSHLFEYLAIQFNTDDFTQWYNWCESSWWLIIDDKLEIKGLEPLCEETWHKYVARYSNIIAKITINRKRKKSVQMEVYIVSLHVSNLMSLTSIFNMFQITDFLYCRINHNQVHQLLHWSTYILHVSWLWSA